MSDGQGEECRHAGRADCKSRWVQVCGQHHLRREEWSGKGMVKQQAKKYGHVAGKSKVKSRLCNTEPVTE